MEKFGERMGVFPALMEPAREAVRKMLQDGTSSAELAGKPGFWVVPKGTVEQERIFYEFDCDGAMFVIVEKEEMP
jgi:hypothetical protein